MKVKTLTKQSDGVILQTTKGQLKVQVCTANIIRVVYTLNQEFSSKDRLMVVQRNFSPVPWELEESNQYIQIVTEKVRLKINKETSAFSYYDQDGTLLMKEPDTGGKYLIPTQVTKTIFDQNAVIKSEASADGVKVRATEAGTVVDRTAYH